MRQLQTHSKIIQARIRNLQDKTWHRKSLKVFYRGRQLHKILTVNRTSFKILFVQFLERVNASNKLRCIKPWIFKTSAYFYMKSIKDILSLFENCIDTNEHFIQLNNASNLRCAISKPATGILPIVVIIIMRKK